ncbi:MAG TPA: 6,7-dimethyl-8-ribityllumazine synthase [Actinomycetota bacterium]|nr:6,7-dimethyl-8-ribityllumazine synthase [Actinomycetota bacterium]
MPQVYEGTFDGRNLKVAIVVGRFNEAIGKRLLEGALDCFKRHNVADADVSVVWVPGAFEIPAAAKRVALSGEVDAIVCLGAVIRGETAHFDFVAGHSSNGIGAVALETGIPITNGILTTETVSQAADRAGGKLGNKGFEAALAALEMTNLFASLPKPSTEI